MRLRVVFVTLFIVRPLMGAEPQPFTPVAFQLEPPKRDSVPAISLQARLGLSIGPDRIDHGIPIQSYPWEIIRQGWIRKFDASGLGSIEQKMEPGLLMPPRRPAEAKPLPGVSGWDLLDKVANNRKPKDYAMAPALERVFIPRAEANGEYHAKLKTISTNGQGQVKIKGNHIFPTYKLAFEATYKSNLPSDDEIRSAKSVQDLEEILGPATGSAGGYDGGGSMLKYYYFTLRDKTLVVYLAEIELSGVHEGQFRLWTGSSKPLH